MNNIMKLIPLIEKLLALGATYTGVNAVETNNGWGFGGRSGADHTFVIGPSHIEFTFETGRLYFRHLAPETVNRIRVAGIPRQFTVELFLRLLVKGGIEAVHKYHADKSKSV